MNGVKKKSVDRLVEVTSLCPSRVGRLLPDVVEQVVAPKLAVLEAGLTARSKFTRLAFDRQLPASLGELFRGRIDHTPCNVTPS